MSDWTSLTTVAQKMEAALVEAKREMWRTARHHWTLADFKNWAVVQQMDDALEAFRALAASQKEGSDG